MVDRILARARDEDEIAGVTDQIGSPTWTRDLAAALIAIARCGACGVFHAVNVGACSRFEQIGFMIECAGVPARVRPVDSSAFPRPAAVPAWSVLSTGKLARETGHRMRPWQEALKDYILTDSPCRPHG